MDSVIVAIIAGTGTITLIARSDIAHPIRTWIKRFLDIVVIFLSRWRSHSIVNQMISIYLVKRRFPMCMMCVGFWLGIPLHFLCGVGNNFLVDMLFFCGIGWLLQLVEDSVYQ